MAYGHKWAHIGLRLTEATESSLTVAWNSAQDEHEVSTLVAIKHAALGDIYYTTAKTFLPNEISAYNIRGLSSGTSYTVKVISGQDGQYGPTAPQ